MYTKIKLIKWENMKKIIFFIVSLAILLTLAACNDDGTTNYSKEVYEAAYDELYNGNGKYEISIELVEGNEKINLDMLVDGYNIRTSDPYLPKYYDYVQLNENKILGYYINDSFKDGSYYTDETYFIQTDEYNTASEAKELYANALITAAVFPLTKEEENPLVLNIQVTSKQNTITKLKIARAKFERTNLCVYA